jgi:hypothetical protein
MEKIYLVIQDYLFFILPRTAISIQTTLKGDRQSCYKDLQAEHQ